MISLSGISYLSTCFPYVFFNPNPPPWTCYWLQQQHQSNLLIYMQKKNNRKKQSQELQQVMSHLHIKFIFPLLFRRWTPLTQALLGGLLASTSSPPCHQRSHNRHSPLHSCCCSWTHHHRSKIPTLRLKTHCGVRTLLRTVANSRSEISGANYLKNNNIIDYHTYKIKI